MGQHDDARVADRISQCTTAVGGVDAACEVVVEHHLLVEHARLLVGDLGQEVHGGQQRRPVRVVVDDDACIWTGTVDLGVDEDRGRDVPGPFQDVALLVDDEDVGGGQLVPPLAVGRRPHRVILAHDGDVTGDVEGVSGCGEDPRGQRHLLRF